MTRSPILAWDLVQDDDVRIERVGGVVGPLLRIGLVGVTCGVGFVLVYSLTVRTVQGRMFGDASLRGALLTRSAMADGAEAILNVVSVASLLGAVALVATVALIRLERVRGIAAIGLLIGANVSTLLLKSHLLERPDLGIHEVAPATLNSLPSGHVTAVFAAVAAFVFVVPTRWRYPASVAGLVLATVTALATMSAGWHRAGDSMAAFLLVGVWFALAAGGVLMAETQNAGDHESFEWPVSTRWLAVICAGTFTLGLTMGVALNAVGQIRDAAFGSWIAFLAGALLISGTAIMVLLGILYMFKLMDTPARPGPEPGARTWGPNLG